MKKLIAASLLTVAAACPALAQVSVSDAWVRATVPHQKGTGAFMNVTAATDARLVAVQSPIAKIVEIHEMRLEGNVMKMRPVQRLELPGGKAVALEPGGFHVMLIGLERQLKAGERVPLTLVVEDRNGKRETVAVDAPVRPLTGQRGQLR